MSHLFLTTFTKLSCAYPILLTFLFKHLLFNYLTFIIFMICILVECNRVPFDLTEAESELVAGFMTEFSSIYFSVIMLCEYLSIIVFCLFLILLFGMYYLLFLFIIIFICLLRASLNRLKYDELLILGWYFLLIILFSLFLILISLSFNIWSSIVSSFNSLYNHISCEYHPIILNSIKLCVLFPLVFYYPDSHFLLDCSYNFDYSCKVINLNSIYNSTNSLSNFNFNLTSKPTFSILYLLALISIPFILFDLANGSENEHSIILTWIYKHFSRKVHP